MLRRGDQVPHFQVRDLSGQLVSYSMTWQRRNLVLVSLTSRDGSYASALNARAAQFREHQTECIITRDDVPGLRAPGVLVADKWGEIVELTSASESARLPSPEELLEWVEYLENRCPECEGEAK